MGFVVDETSALILVDVQRDFCTGGALPVPEGDHIVPVLNRYVTKFVKASAPIYATRDWHPPHHVSFTPQGGPWPQHCVQNTDGAAFHPGLALPERVQIVSKAREPSSEAYSGFDGTDLAEALRNQGIRRLFIGGLATDYCVKNTVLDALDAGFDVILLKDAIRGVDVTAGDSDKAIRDMVEKGAKKATFNQIV
jgi:nicotinamidase-related amidase